jgi:hypothetical protein
MNNIPFDPYDFFGYLASGLLVVVGMNLTLGFPRVFGQDLKLIDSAVLLLGIYVVGQVIATPAKALLEDGVVEKLLGQPSINLLRMKKPWVRALLFPGFYKQLPEHIREKIIARAARDQAPGSGEPLFLHVRYHPDILNNEKLIAKLDGFLNKYGFARNLAFASLTLGAAMLIRTHFAPNPELKKYAFTALVAGVLLFYRYLKFIRQYSFELFNHYAGGA